MKNNKPPYLIGILCLFPIIGFFVGVAMLLLGIFKYRNKLFAFIGLGGILISVTVCGAMFYYQKYGEKTTIAFSALSQDELNKLANTIEVYKLKERKYPDSLAQLDDMDPSVDYYDPLLVRKMDNDINTAYQYQNMVDSYKVFSVGVDGVANTKDDIYPTVLSSATLKYGFVKKQN
ncbi:type II secretion system protein GspG [Taibaiella soli]|uniref:Type II secretion system protein GspG C-terminal domain-containing protein n=1 Tax=Taibaiella soli TaxID=1649169 RepID=A0A2W2C156_9BACT|nr:type II secretion system protein GspG [Taibaiella soli]PZF73753.1 hypothetical protein DN068_07080 [Taibaiella soli]